MALCFPEDRAFRILQLTDWHSDKSESAAARTRRAVQQMVAAEQPDFLAITGDIWCGDKYPFAAPLLLERDCAFIDGLGIPWSICFGNHDWIFPRTEVLQRLQKRRHFLMPQADPLGNCVIPILNAAGTPLWRLFFLQTDLQWRPETIAWFRAQTQAAPNGPPAVAFYHIPLRLYHEAIIDNRFEGQVHEDVLYWGDEDGAASAAFLEAPQLRGGFCGHSHEIRGHFLQHNTCFVYGCSTGYGGYGTRLAKGATRIELDRDGGLHYAYVYPEHKP